MARRRRKRRGSHARNKNTILCRRPWPAIAAREITRTTLLLGKKPQSRLWALPSLPGLARRGAIARDCCGWYPRGYSTLRVQRTLRNSVGIWCRSSIDRSIVKVAREPYNATWREGKWKNRLSFAVTLRVFAGFFFFNYLCFCFNCLRSYAIVISEKTIDLIWAARFQNQRIINLPDFSFPFFGRFRN